jgi:hypothetical protein
MSSKFCAMAGLALGALLLVWWGATAPLWLRMIECVGVMGAALIFGFTAYSPSAPEWTRDDAVRGVALVYGGVGVVFIDLSLIASAFLIGSGLRLVCKSASRITARVVSGTGLNHQSGEIVVIKQSGEVDTRN